MKLSVSLGAFERQKINIVVQQLIDRGYVDFHVDICDEHQNLDLLELINHHHSVTEVHFISDNEALLKEILQQYKVDYLALDFVTCKGIFEKIKNRYPNINIGFSFPSNECFESIAPYLERIDFISVMSTSPGQSGLKFNRESMKLVQYLNEKYPTLRLHIDGGIDPSILKSLKGISLKQFVSGSFLSNSDCINTALNSFEDSMQYCSS